MKIFVLLGFVMFFASLGVAQEKPPDVVLLESIDNRVQTLEGRFQVLESEISEVGQGIAVLAKAQEEMPKTLEAKIDGISDRLDDLWALILVLIVSIFGMVGFMFWDRKTTLKPVLERLEKLEQARVAEDAVEAQFRERLQ